MRLALVRAAEREHWVLWTFHHALLDGRSFPLVLREVFAFHEDGDTDLPLPRPYRDHIEWLRKLDHESAKPYWQGALADFRAATPLVVARDREAEHVTGADRAAHEIRLSGAFTTALRERARDASVTLNTLLQAAWALLLHRYSGESDIVFGATRACRRSTFSGADEMVGLFINTLPLRVRVDPEAELVPWLQQLRAQQVALREYEHTPLVKVQGWSDVPRGRRCSRPSWCSRIARSTQQLRALGGGGSTRLFRYLGQTNYPLTVIAYGDRGAPAAARVLAAALRGQRRCAHAGPSANAARGHARSTAGQAERPAAADRGGAASGDFGVEQGGVVPQGGCLHERFERQVELTPDAVALVYEGQRLTYGELNRRANAACPPPARARCDQRSAGRLADRAQPGDGGRARRDPEGWRGLSAARPGVSEGSGRLHARGLARRRRRHATESGGRSRGLAVTRVLLDEPLAGGRYESRAGVDGR